MLILCRYVSCSIVHLTSPYGFHARSFHGYCEHRQIYVGHMKLLRVLNFESYPPRSIIGGVQSLVQLRYLVITDLPASIGSLVNLEYLRVTKLYEIVIPSVIPKMMKLRCFHVTDKARYHEDCDSSQTNNLQSLSGFLLDKLKDEEMLRCSPNLRKLKCECEPLYVGEEKGKYEYRYPDFRFLTVLDSLDLIMTPYSEAEVALPANIRKLSLGRVHLRWEKMPSVIGALPNLEVLKLQGGSFVGETWETRGDEFQKLRFLKLQELYVQQWNVASSDHFPKLERLVLRDCYLLREIPCEIGEVSTLQSIELELSCQNSLVESATTIEQEQRDIGNEQLRILSNIR